MSFSLLWHVYVLNSTQLPYWKSTNKVIFPPMAVWDPMLQPGIVGYKRLGDLPLWRTTHHRFFLSLDSWCNGIDCCLRCFIGGEKQVSTDLLGSQGEISSLSSFKIIWQQGSYCQYYCDSLFHWSQNSILIFLIMIKLAFSHLWTLNMRGNQTRINL